jgi:hypothetical protein
LDPNSIPLQHAALLNSLFKCSSPDDEVDPLLLSLDQPPPSVLADFPPLGTALPIVPENMSLAALPLLPAAGRWYKFRNLRVVREKGSLKGYWGRSTKVMGLEDSERHVQERLRWEAGIFLCPFSSFFY